MASASTKEIVCRDINGQECIVTSDQMEFRPGVYGLLIENDSLLLFNQKKGYDFPGGGVELHETLTEALQREFWEETGLQVEPIKLLNCFSSRYHDRLYKKFYNSIQIYYLCRRTGRAKLSTENLDEHEKVYALGPEWVNLNSIDQIKFQNSVDSVALIQQAINEIKL